MKRVLLSVLLTACLSLAGCSSPEEQKAVAAVQQHIQAQAAKVGPYTPGHTETEKGMHTDSVGHKTNGIFVTHEFEVENEPDKKMSAKGIYFVDYTGKVTQVSEKN